MTVLVSILSLMVLQGSSFRVGFTFDGSFPAMSDERDYSDLLNEGDLDFKLDDVTWTGGLEALGDVSEKLRLRGSVSVSNFHGTYEENYNPLGYMFLGIFTCGLAFLFGSPDDEVISLEDESLNIEAAAYYKLTESPAVSIGGGPSIVMVSRTIDTPETESSAKATGMGFNAGIRIDQESGFRFLGLPLVLGAEAGYRYCNVKLDEENTGDFSVDFSGPYVKVGTYLNL